MEGNRALRGRGAGEGGGRAGEKGGDSKLHCSDRFWWLKVLLRNVALAVGGGRDLSFFELNLRCLKSRNDVRKKV